MTSLPPVVVGGAVVVPQGLIDRLDGIVGDRRTADRHAAAVKTVLESERQAGRRPHAVVGERLGYDVVSQDKLSGHRFVKVIVDLGEPTVAMSHNETFAALNVGAAYWLALVEPQGLEVRWAHPSVDSRVAFDQATFRVTVS